MIVLLNFIPICAYCGPEWEEVPVGAGLQASKPQADVSDAIFVQLVVHVSIHSLHETNILI